MIPKVKFYICPFESTGNVLGLLGHNCHLSVTQAPSNWHKMTQLGIIARLV